MRHSFRKLIIASSILFIALSSCSEYTQQGEEQATQEEEKVTQPPCPKERYSEDLLIEERDTIYDVTNDKVSRISNTIHTFDSNGNRILSEYYSEGVLRSKDVYEYNSEGLLVRKISGDYIFTVSYIDEKTIKVELYYGSELDSYGVFHFSDSNHSQLLRIESVSITYPEASYTDSYSYDERGKLLFSGAEGETEYSYPENNVRVRNDSKGNVYKETFASNYTKELVHSNYPPMYWTVVPDVDILTTEYNGEIQEEYKYYDNGLISDYSMPPMIKASYTYDDNSCTIETITEIGGGRFINKEVLKKIYK